MLRRSSWHVASWLEARARKKLGMRMAARIARIATTIRSSIGVSPARPRQYRTCVCTFPPRIVISPPYALRKTVLGSAKRSVVHLFEGKNAGGRKRLLKGETPLPKELTDATFHPHSMPPSLHRRTCVRPVSTSSTAGAPAGSAASPATATAPAQTRWPAVAAQLSPDRSRSITRRHQHGRRDKSDFDEIWASLRPPRDDDRHGIQLQSLGDRRLHPEWPGQRRLHVEQPVETQ